jgi:hypothetical protein
MTRPFTTEVLTRRMKRATAQAADARAHRRARDPRPRPRLLHRLPAGRDHRADHHAGAAGLAGAGHDRPRPGAARRRGRPRRGRSGPDRLADGSDPYTATAGLLDPRGRYGISDSAWAMQLLGLQQALPDSGYVSMTGALPMLRAVRTPRSWSGSSPPAPPPTPVSSRSWGCGSPAAASATSAPTWPGSSEITATRRFGFTVVGSGPNGANPTTR